uniref:Uncharacterized protein n=1 Tax=Timema shepardi TaxID=629360 RepID=A0A7R9FX68_TIMSH|nr:unnamed protein product [Timema shepardi]
MSTPSARKNNILNTRHQDSNPDHSITDNLVGLCYEPGALYLMPTDVRFVIYCIDEGEENGVSNIGLLAVSSGSASPTPPPHSSTSTLPATSSSTTAVTSSAPVARPGSPPTTPGAPPPRCCETGRPIYTDPLTGQTVCSCQYDLLSYQRLASAGVGAAGIPALSMYSAPYADGMAAYFPALGADQAPFYTATAAGLELKENLASGAAWPYPSVYHPYDAAFAGYPFNGVNYYTLCDTVHEENSNALNFSTSRDKKRVRTKPNTNSVQISPHGQARRPPRACAVQQLMLINTALILCLISFLPSLPPCSPEQMRECSPPPVYTHICCQIKGWCLSARVIGNERNTSIVKCSEFSSSDPEDLGSITGTSRFFCEAVGLERGQLNLMRFLDNRTNIVCEEVERSDIDLLPWIHECRPLTVDTRVSTSYRGHKSDIDLLPWIHECRPLTVDTRVSTSHREYKSDIDLLPWIHDSRPLTVDTRVSTSHRGHKSDIDLLPWIHDSRPLTVDTRVT